MKRLADANARAALAEARLFDFKTMLIVCRGRHEAGLPSSDRAGLGKHPSRLKHKHVTLSILWDEYVERNPEGYRYSRFGAAFLSLMASTLLQRFACARISQPHPPGYPPDVNCNAHYHRF